MQTLRGFNKVTFVFLTIILFSLVFVFFIGKKISEKEILINQTQQQYSGVHKILVDKINKKS